MPLTSTPVHVSTKALTTLARVTLGAHVDRPHELRAGLFASVEYGWQPVEGGSGCGCSFCSNNTGVARSQVSTKMVPSGGRTCG